MSDWDQELQEGGPTAPAVEPMQWAESVELGGGVPAGLLALADLDDGGDSGLVALGGRAVQGEQDALAGQDG